MHNEVKKTNRHVIVVPWDEKRIYKVAVTEKINVQFLKEIKKSIDSRITVNSKHYESLEITQINKAKDNKYFKILENLLRGFCLLVLIECKRENNVLRVAGPSDNILTAVRLVHQF